MLDRDEQVFRDANQWFGETDLSAKIYVMWDDANLYIAAEKLSPYNGVKMVF